MSFSIRKQADVVVVDVEGQLIVGNRQELKQKVLDELEKGERKFLIDFSQTGYIDSSGLGVLVSLSKKIREQGGELRLAAPTRKDRHAMAAGDRMPNEMRSDEPGAAKNEDVKRSRLRFGPQWRGTNGQRASGQAGCLEKVSSGCHSSGSSGVGSRGQVLQYDI